MNSCLYECDIMHHRLEPKKNKFSYRLFMFYFDLDELPFWNRTLRLFSWNAANLFSFRDSDHLDRGLGQTKKNILHYLQSQGVDLSDGRIMLLTHLRMFGYVFNPVSFYFCFDPTGNPVCSVAEVGNTFGEKKPYLIMAGRQAGQPFRQRIAKDFYVSPFIDLDTEFDFDLSLPAERLAIHIDDYKDGRRFLLTSLTGKRKALTDAQLAGYTLRFPFLTLKIIFLIHWQALVLWLKGLPFLKKADHPELQKGVYHAKHS